MSKPGVFRARIDPADVEAVAAIAKSLGYVYGEDSPYWKAFFRAIASGEVIMFKKVDPPS